MSLRSGRKHKAQGDAKRNPGSRRKKLSNPCNGRQSEGSGSAARIRGFRDRWPLTQGSASLHAGLYASACSAGSLNVPFAARVSPLSAARSVGGISVGLPFCNTTTVIVPSMASSSSASKT